MTQVVHRRGRDEEEEFIPQEAPQERPADAARRQLIEQIEEAQTLAELSVLQEEANQFPGIHRHSLNQQIEARHTALKETQLHLDSMTQEVREEVESAAERGTEEGDEIDDNDADSTMPEKEPVDANGEIIKDPSVKPLSVSKLLEGLEPIGKGSIATAYRTTIEGIGPVIIKRGKPGDEEYFERAKAAFHLLRGVSGIPQLLEAEAEEPEVEVEEEETSTDKEREAGTTEEALETEENEHPRLAFEAEHFPFIIYRDTPGADDTFTELNREKVKLKQAFQELPMEKKEAFVEAAAQVIAEVHSRGLVHGDLGLDHVLMYPDESDEASLERESEQGEGEDEAPEIPKEWLPLLIDFAFAHLTEEAQPIEDGLSSLHSLPEGHGKNRYATPDMNLGYRVDQQIEVEQFAWIACELLTGELPNRGNIRELLEEAKVNQELIEKLVAATATREKRYANMKEFVENPFSRCAAELIPSVLERLEAVSEESPADWDLIEKLKDEYIQRELIRHASVSKRAGREEKRRALKLLKKALDVLSGQRGKRGLIIEELLSHLESSDWQTTALTITTLDISPSQYRRAQNEADARHLYKRAREILFRSVGQENVDWKEAQRAYFRASSRGERPYSTPDPTLVFNDQIRDEEEAFFWGLMHGSHLGPGVGSMVFQSNATSFSHEALERNQRSVDDFMQSAPHYAGRGLLNIIRAESQALEDGSGDADMNRNRWAQETLLDFAQRVDQDSAYQYGTNHALFADLLQSLEEDEWLKQFQNEIRPLCLSERERIGEDLLAGRPTVAGNAEMSRREQIRRFFSRGQESEEQARRRFARVPLSTQVTWLLEFMRGHHVRDDEGIIQRLHEMPPSAFTADHIRQLQQLIFIYSEREGNRNHRFGQQNPVALEVDIESLQRLVTVEQASSDGENSMASTALTEALRELEERLKSFWFIEADTRRRITEIVESISSFYHEDERGRAVSVKDALDRCETALGFKTFWWVVLGIFASARQYNIPRTYRHPIALKNLGSHDQEETKQAG